MSGTSSASQSDASQVTKVPRTLVIDASMASGASAQSIMTIPQDADFEWDWMGAFRTSNLLKVTIAEQGAASTPFIVGVSNQSPFQGIFIDLLCGLASNNALYPMIVPYILPAARSYQHVFYDQTSGAQNNVELVYYGSALKQVATNS
jgi:hypothetical protein